MGGGFERGAVYIPRYARDGRAVAAPDEDPFTMLVAAAEALNLPSAAPSVARIHLVGEFPVVVDWGLPAYFGESAEIVRHPGTSAGLSSAVQEATLGSDDQGVLVGAVDWDALDGAKAVVLRFGPSPAPAAPDWTSLSGDGGAASLARAVRLGGSAAGNPVRSALPFPTAWSAERTATFTSTKTDRVSEGAYVPRARYLENLPSRWRLEADRCTRCGRLTFPSRARCRHCGRSDQLTKVALPRDGARVVAATAIGKGGQPTEFDPQVEALGGYGVVLAEFEPGVRLTLQVTDAGPGEVRIGERIGTRLRRLYPMDGEWRYGRKAVPLPP